jgi:hypothetical protein
VVPSVSRFLYSEPSATAVRAGKPDCGNVSPSRDVRAAAVLHAIRSGVHSTFTGPWRRMPSTARFPGAPARTRPTAVSRIRQLSFLGLSRGRDRDGVVAERLSLHRGKEVTELVDFVWPRSESPTPNPKLKGDLTMRFMMMVKSAENSGPPPKQELASPRLIWT